MISVIATISVKPGTREQFLAVFKANVPAVLEEDGCIEYFPAVDIDSGLPPQELDPNAVVILEKWESLTALRAHLASPHMAEYREKVKDIVQGVSLKVLTPA